MNIEVPLFYNLKSKVSVLRVSPHHILFSRRRVLPIVCLFVLTSLAVLPAMASARETGFQSPSRRGDDYHEWGNPNRAYTSNDLFARSDSLGKAQDWFDFNFPLPGDAIIEGIQVDVEGNNQSQANGVDIELSWDGGASYTSSGKGAIWPISSVDSIESFGGPGDGWGRTWSAAECSDSNFRVRLTRKGATEGVDFQVDHIQINVTFSSDTYLLGASQDSYLKEASPTTNFELNAEILTKKKPTDSLRGIYQFDISSLPGAAVTGATLRLFVTKEAPSSVQIHRVTAPWTEMGVNWSNTAANYDPVPDGSFTPSINGDYVYADLTALVAEWHAGTPNYGILLISDGNDQETKYTSREWGIASQKPRLDVTMFGVSLPLEPDLSINKTVDTPLATPGSSVTYTITLTNWGPENATGVQVMDSLPSGVTFQGYWSTQGTYNDTSGLWDLGAVDFGVTDTLQIVVTVD